MEKFPHCNTSVTGGIMADEIDRDNARELDLVWARESKVKKKEELNGH
jgi:hypothetical protein